MVIAYVRDPFRIDRRADQIQPGQRRAVSLHIHGNSHVLTVAVKVSFFLRVNRKQSGIISDIPESDLDDALSAVRAFVPCLFGNVCAVFHVIIRSLVVKPFPNGMAGIDERLFLAAEHAHGSLGHGLLLKLAGIRRHRRDEAAALFDAAQHVIKAQQPAG